MHVPVPMRQQAQPANDGAQRRDSAVSELEELLRRGKMTRAVFEPVWFMNLAYYAGDQWLAWNGGQLVRPRLRKDRVLLVDNRIQPAVRRQIAKKTKTRPTFTCTPSTASEEDVIAARLGEVAMHDLWRRLLLSKRLKTALRWADITGAGFWKLFWDSKVGAKGRVLLGPDGEILTDENDRPIKPEAWEQILGQLQQLDPAAHERAVMGVKEKEVYEGDVGVEVRSPFQLAIDDLAEVFDEAAWIVDETVKDPDYVKRRYDVDLKPDSEASVGLIEGRLSASAMGGVTNEARGVRVKELWARPSSQFPKGRRVVWAGNQILHEDSNPYERLPYVMFSGIEVPGRLYPTCITEAMRGPQTELNKAKSQVSENRVRIGNPALLVSKQAGVKYTGLPGERIEFDDTTMNALPRYLQPPEMPAYVQNEIQDIQQALMEASGAHEVSAAQVPAGVTAAAAIQLLQEADDTMVGPEIEDMETQLSVAGTMLLELVAKHYTTGRTIRITGEDAEFEILDFKGSMLRGNTGVEVQAGSAMPQSKAAKQAEMTQVLTLFVQNGVPLRERALRRFFREYDAGALERLFGDLGADEKQINREHRLMTLGTPVEVNLLVDNHQAHIEGHREWMKSPKYAQLIEANPQVRQLHEAHLQTHLDEDMKQSAPAPGLPPGGGEVAGAPPLAGGDSPVSENAAGVGGMLPTG